MRKKDFRYDVALSFAEENCDFVDAVVAHLKEKNVRYYFYKETKTLSWGKKLDRYLDNIYRKESRFCVIFISEHYKVKKWTNFEMKKARKRAVRDINEYILPFRLDNTSTEIPAIDTADFLSADDYDPPKLAQAIYDKIQAQQMCEMPRSFIVNLVTDVRFFFSKPINATLTILISLALLAFNYPDQLMPVSTLAKRIHNRSKITRCSRCRDSSFSWSRGRGACSHHQGVAYEFDTIAYRKNYVDCIQEAKKISWLSKFSQY